MIRRARLDALQPVLVAPLQNGLIAGFPRNQHGKLPNTDAFEQKPLAVVGWRAANRLLSRAFPQGCAQGLGSQ